MDGCRLSDDGFRPETLANRSSYEGVLWRNDPDRGREDGLCPMNHPIKPAPVMRLFIQGLILTFAGFLVQAGAVSKAMLQWGVGPLVMHPQPVLSPNADSKFTCAVLGKEVGWEAQNVHNPAAELLLVEKGVPRAEIVVDGNRPRMVTLAALELRHFVQKMSGARLPIVTEPTAGTPVRIHVGQSAETDRLGVTAQGLGHGAYRMASGPGWLALIGKDRDFAPGKIPWPMSRKDVPRAAAEWAKATEGITDAAWGFPFASGFKAFWNPKDFTAQMTARYGEDFSRLWKNEPGVPAGFWNHDEGGSLNAVYGLLRSLGVRWYMPGELGEVIPAQATISVSPLKETVKPDYPLRNWTWYNFGGFAYDDIIWARRLGMNSGYELLGPNTGPHGLVHVLSEPAMQKAHPDYYALIGGKRDTAHRERGTPCFSSSGLEAETVKYLRFLFDRYDLPSLDIWPVDGLRLCQCEKCEGKTASDLVWGFADRVARQVSRTHPAKRITCGAYTSYVEPPDSIKQFSPNLSVWVANCGRPMMLDAERWADYLERIRKWREKVAPGNLLRLENNRYHIWGDGEPISYPVLHPQGVARDLKALKGISLGDTGEQSQVGGQWRAPALEHITLYVQSRFLWDAEQDVEQVLDEYCSLFYGPAAQAMKEAITFAEQNLAFKDQSRGRGRGNPANVSLAVNLRFRELLEGARQLAGNTIYGKRIQAILAELQPKDQLLEKHRTRAEALAQARAKAPVAVGIEGPDLGKATVYSLQDNLGGGPPAAPTTFRVGWDQKAIIFDLVCSEPDMAKLNVSRDVYHGDHVVVLLETPSHSYYHLEINPAGVIAEGNPGPSWKSLAEITAERGRDSWRVRLKIPVVSETEAQSDPKHRVAGGKPTAQAPWYFNVGRQRALDRAKPERQAFCPTKAGWHIPEKFAKLRIE